MAKDLMPELIAIALETMHGTQEDETFLSVGEWYASLSNSDQKLLEDTRKTPEAERKGNGLRLLLEEERLRFKTIAKNDSFRK